MGLNPFGTGLLCAVLLVMGMGSHSATAGEIGQAHAALDYSRLFDFLLTDKVLQPAVLFLDNQGEFDQELNRQNIAYLNENKALLESIRKRLNGAEVKWRLAGSSKRVLVVPEDQPERARLFECYCREATDLVLGRLGLPSPYAGIATFQEGFAGRPEGPAEKVTAYLVYDITDEYVEDYLFYTSDGQGTKLKIRLSNRVSSAKIGSYSSNLKINPNDSYEFVRDSYTLWQRSAKEPMNALIAPVEETLHILLRGSTERALGDDLAARRPADLSQVRQVVDDWMAVEEAVVGGLVSRLMPDIFHYFFNDALQEMLDAAMAARKEQAQYRFLPIGIRIVAELGPEAATALYAENPMRFKEILFLQAASGCAGPPS